MRNSLHTTTAEQTIKLGAEFASRLQGGEVLCLYGELGAGKTTFTHGLIRYFLPSSRVMSPTFILVREYTVTDNNIRKIYHVDLYRLQKEQEIEEIGMLQWLHQPDTVVIIEWPERMGSLLPEKRIDIRFKVVEEGREVETVEVGM